MDRKIGVGSASWLKLNNEFQRLKIVNIVLLGLSVITTLSLVLVAIRSPLVVSINELGEKEFQRAKRINLTVTERDLEAVALKFIHARYSWSEFNIDSIIDGVTPFVTNNLKKKIKSELLKLKKQFPKDKEVTLSINDLKTDVSMEKILVSFDQIIKVDGVPLINPTEIEFLMMKDSPNALNPMGVFINNIAQFEEL